MQLNISLYLCLNPLQRQIPRGINSSVQYSTGTQEGIRQSRKYTPIFTVGLR